MNALRKLTELGSSAIGTSRVEAGALRSVFDSEAVGVVLPLLELRNGFYAFEGALHVFAEGVGAPGEWTLAEWNAEKLWKQEYQGMADGLLCFAEDVFGMQFCAKNGSIFRFDPETGQCEAVARDANEWAELILHDYSLWTGHVLVHNWQEEHGPIPIGSRLVPITPFVLGGAFTLENCHVLEAAKAMQYRASIAVQIRNLPDGATVRLRTSD